MHPAGKDNTRTVPPPCQKWIFLMQLIFGMEPSLFPNLLIRSHFSHSDQVFQGKDVFEFRFFMG